MNDHRKYDATFPNFFLFRFVFLSLTSNERAMHFVIGSYLLRSYEEQRWFWRRLDEMIAMKNGNQNLLEASCEWFMSSEIYMYI